MKKLLKQTRKGCINLYELLVVRPAKFMVRVDFGALMTLTAVIGLSAFIGGTVCSEVAWQDIFAWTYFWALVSIMTFMMYGACLSLLTFGKLRVKLAKKYRGK